MCNGDLGMYRVMPWAYPTIPGQSSGGTSVDPTPEPVPESTPYDFSGAKLTWRSRTNSMSVGGFEGSQTYPFVRFWIDIDGVKVNDNSNVASIVMTVTENTTSVSPTSFDGYSRYSSKDKEVRSIDWGNTKDFSNSSANIGMTFYYTPKVTVPYSNSTIFTLSGTFKVKLKAYDADGKLLQESEEITVGG